MRGKVGHKFLLGGIQMCVNTTTINGLESQTEPYAIKRCLARKSRC